MSYISRQHIFVLFIAAFAISTRARISKRRRLNVGAECETAPCESDPLCSNTQDPCDDPTKRCYFEGWGDDGLVRTKCHEYSKQGCDQITSYPSYFEPYTYVPGDPTSKPLNSNGPSTAGPCVFPFEYGGVTYTNTCSTANEPSPASPNDEGHAALPWCFINAAQTEWAYCFPEGSPSCGYDDGWLRQNKGSLSECSLKCKDGYEGYAFATCPKKNQPVDFPSDALSGGCVPVLCSDYIPSEGVGGSSFSNACESFTQLQAGESCTVACLEGYAQASGSGLVECQLSSSSGDAVVENIICTEVQCSPLALGSITAASVTGEGLSNGCTENVTLTTHGERCRIRCTGDTSATPFTWEISCPLDASTDNTSPPVIAGTVSCDGAKCASFVYSASEGLVTPVSGGCPEDVVTLNGGASCDLACSDGWKATNASFRDPNIQTLECGDPYGNGTLSLLREPSCEPNSCAAFIFETGMESASGNGCANGTVLVTHASGSSASWCFVKCKSGYRVTLTDGTNGKVVCPTDAAEGSQPSYTHRCEENSCTSREVAAGFVGFASNGTNACDGGFVELTTHTNPSCGVRCGDGYSHTGSVSNFAFYSCASDAENGALSELSPSSFACVENKCSAIELPVGTVGIGASPCDDGTVLVTHSEPRSCNITCDAGFAPSASSPTYQVLTCPSNASSGFRINSMSLDCEVAVTSVGVSCATSTEGCSSAASAGMSFSEAGIQDCTDPILNAAIVDSGILVATEGGDTITFGGFTNANGIGDASDDTWFLTVGSSQGNDCTRNVSTSELRCEIPPGRGAKLPLFLNKYSSGDVSSAESTGLLDGCVVTYASPVVLNISGCPPEGCDRNGGDVVTIHGTNFGSEGALVFVNGIECNNLTHGVDVACDNTTLSGNAQECHRALTCTVPGLESFQARVNHMLVVQSNRFGSYHMEYEKCPLGKTQEINTPNCSSCGPGTYNDILDAFECIPCEAGFFASVPESDVCLPCPKNTKSSSSIGSSSCTKCSGGTYAGEGSESCSQCSVWYLGETDGHCETPVFGIVFGILSSCIVMLMAFCLVRRYADLVSLVETTRDNQTQLEKDVAMLQSAWELKWDQIEIVSKIAEGGGGVVYRGKLDGMKVAVKTIFDTRDTHLADQTEVRWMQRARHPRLVLFFGMGKRPPPSGNIFVVIELMENGDLLSAFEKAAKSKKGMSWEVRKTLMYDIADGMEYIHETLQSIHRDLKSENVLLREVGGVVRAKVSDFGLSRIVPEKKKKTPKRLGTTISLFTSNTSRSSTSSKRRSSGIEAQGSDRLNEMISDVSTTSASSKKSSLRFSEALMTSARGTVAYMAPELLSREALRNDTGITYSQSVDSYAFGLILWEALCLRRAWGDFKFSTQVIDRVTEGLRPSLPKSYNPPLLAPPKGFNALMTICWHQKPEMRPKFTQIKAAIASLDVESGVAKRTAAGRSLGAKPKHSLTASDVRDEDTSALEVELAEML